MVDICSCGHVEDEHADNGTCEVDECLCAGWEEADEDDEVVTE